MKKLLVGILTLALLVFMPVTVAAQLEEIGQTATIDVTINEGNRDTVYYVELSWGGMDFYYDATWNPGTHQYDSVEWTCAENANKITITNRSNSAIAIQFSFNTDTDAVGVFHDASDTAFNFINLDSAEGTSVDDAPYCEVYFDLGYDKPVGNGNIGSITIELLP